MDYQAGHRSQSQCLRELTRARQAIAVEAFTPT